jgi:hypothetical protein
MVKPPRRRAIEEACAKGGLSALRIDPYPPKKSSGVVAADATPIIAFNDLRMSGRRLVAALQIDPLRGHADRNLTVRSTHLQILASTGPIPHSTYAQTLLCPARTAGCAEALLSSRDAGFEAYGSMETFWQIMANACCPVRLDLISRRTRFSVTLIPEKDQSPAIKEPKQ